MSNYRERGRDSGRDSDRGRDRDSGRGRDDDRGAARGREPERSRDSGRSSSRYTYERNRTREDVDRRASMGSNEFDRFLDERIKMWKPRDGDNRIRILPPTWANPGHYGFDIFVHYGVGPDRGSYLDLFKMKDGGRDPITEEMAALRRSGRADEQDIKRMDSKRRVLVYLIDRDAESEGLQAWAMPWTVDRDISVVSVDKSTSDILYIDDPEEGYDVEFRKDGKNELTKYVGVSIARRASQLDPKNRGWLDEAVSRPLPDQLKFYSYEDIAKAFGGAGELRERGRDDERGDRNERSRDVGRGEPGRDDRSDGRGDGRGDSDSRDDRNRSDADRGGNDDRGSDRGRGVHDAAPRRGGSRDSAPPSLTWDDIHNMTGAELDALVESDDRLHGIKVNEADSDAILAGWICEDLKITKPEARPARRAPAEDAGAGDKLREMRESRERR